VDQYSELKEADLVLGTIMHSPLLSKPWQRSHARHVFRSSYTIYQGVTACPAAAGLSCIVMLRCPQTSQDMAEEQYGSKETQNLTSLVANLSVITVINKQ